MNGEKSLFTAYFLLFTFYFSFTSHFFGVGVAINVHQPVSGTSVLVGVDGECVIAALQLLSMPGSSDPR